MVDTIVKRHSALFSCSPCSSLWFVLPHWVGFQIHAQLILNNAGRRATGKRRHAALGAHLTLQIAPPIAGTLYGVHRNNLVSNRETQIALQTFI